MKYCFVFICQGGDIEAKAVLLAASIHSFVKCKAEIVACVPCVKGVPLPAKYTYEYFRGLNIRVEHIDNPIANDYLIGNKLSCLNISTDAEVLIFLDSDMLFVQEFYGSNILETSAFAARLTDFSDLTPDEWNAIYTFCDLDIPAFTYKSMVTGEVMPLCFNSGFIATKNPQRVYRSWVKWARKLNDPVRFPKTRPFLDQVSLPLAILESGIEYKILGQAFNYSSAIYPVDKLEQPYIVHYHDKINLLGDDFVAEVGRYLTHQFKELQELLRNDPVFSFL